MQGSQLVYVPPPKTTKNLRACLTCKLIKSPADFKSRLCDNCVPASSYHTQKEGERADWVLQNTTSEFDGWRNMADIDDSGRKVPFLPGLYAVEVVGGQTLQEQDEYGDGEGEEDDFIDHSEDAGVGASSKLDDDEEDEDLTASLLLPPRASGAGQAPGRPGAEEDSEDDGDFVGDSDAGSGGSGESSDDSGSEDDHALGKARASAAVQEDADLEDDDDF